MGFLLLSGRSECLSGLKRLVNLWHVGYGVEVASHARIFPLRGIKPYYCPQFVVLQLWADGEKFMKRTIVWFV
jgi:hypothetical protein